MFNSQAPMRARGAAQVEPTTATPTNLIPALQHILHWPRGSVWQRSNVHAPDLRERAEAARLTKRVLAAQASGGEAVFGVRVLVRDRRLVQAYVEISASCGSGTVNVQRDTH